MYSGQTSNNRGLQAMIPPKESDRLPEDSGAKSVFERRDIKGMTWFDPSRISEEDYEEYIGFVESVWNSSSKGLVPHRFSLDNALEVLHRSRYSLSRAKFWIQFPLIYRMEMEVDEEEGRARSPSYDVQKKQDRRPPRRGFG